MLTNSSPLFLSTLKTYLAAVLNATKSPDYFAWRTTLDLHVLTDEEHVGDDGVTLTNFVWGGSQGGYTNRSDGERDAFTKLFNTALACKPSLGNVRTAIVDIFSGSGSGAVANRAHFNAAARRPINVIESLFVVQTTKGPAQTGNRGTRTNPDTLQFEGNVTEQDLVNARGYAG